MPFHNHLLPEIQIPDTSARAPFHSLQEGDNYQNKAGGQVYRVIEDKPKFKTVRRYDDWLLHLHEGCWVWDRMVIKL